MQGLTREKEIKKSINLVAILPQGLLDKPKLPLPAV